MLVGNFCLKNNEYILVDLPGTYSIMSNSEEEEIARDYICFGMPDVTVVVLDATCLERNLNLLFQIMEITDKVIVCVNLLDEAKKKKIDVNLKNLERILGVPVVGTIAQKKKTLDNLKEIIYKVSTNKLNPIPKTVEYENKIEANIEKIKDIIKDEYVGKFSDSSCFSKNITLNKESKDVNIISDKLYRWIAIKALDGDKKILESIEENLKISLDTEIISQNLEEAKKDLKAVGITEENFKDKIVENIVNRAEQVTKEVCKFNNSDYSSRDRKIDRILTSKKWGIPIMLLFLAIIFWITIVLANYPSEFLFSIFESIGEKLMVFANYINCPEWLSNMLILGMYQTLTWVISVMLPPMAIFFPLFTILEDMGYLTRIAFNMDGFFKKACSSGKQMITMCMGFGCNSCGVTGCRIIESPRERLIAIITNNLVPCNRQISISNNNSKHIYSK